MNKLLISVFAVMASTFGIAEAAVVEFGAKVARDRTSISQGNSLTSVGGISANFVLREVAISDKNCSERRGRADACVTPGLILVDCSNLTCASAFKSAELKSETFMIEHEFDLARFSFLGDRRFSGHSRHMAFYIDGARSNFRILFGAMLAGVTSMTIVTGEPALTEFDQNGAATIPIPASALLILTGLGAFGVAARRRRKHAI